MCKMIYAFGTISEKYRTKYKKYCVWRNICGIINPQHNRWVLIRVIYMENISHDFQSQNVNRNKNKFMQTNI